MEVNSRTKESGLSGNCIAQIKLSRYLGFTFWYRNKYLVHSIRMYRTNSGFFLFNCSLIWYKGQIMKSLYMVVKILNSNTCENFENYFTRNIHNANTRNKGRFATLPIVKLEFARRTFYHMGTKMFNDFP